MSQYTDLVVFKTNKPNSKKTISEFMAEFGYKDYETDSLENKGRTAAINFIAEDIEDEILNFSREEAYKGDKFTVQYFKMSEDKKEQHLFKTLEIINGKISLSEVDNIITSLIDKKELESKKIIQPTVEEQQVKTQHTRMVFSNQNNQEVKPFKKTNNRDKFSKKFDQSKSTPVENVKPRQKTKKEVNKVNVVKPITAEKEVIDLKEKQRLNNLKANQNNPNHPDYDPSVAAKKKKPKHK